MLRRTFLLSLLATPSAWAAAEQDGVLTSLSGDVRADLLSSALKAWSARPDARQDMLGIVDFSKPSWARRLTLIDLKTARAEKFLTAHGRGSDPEHSGFAHIFSNVAESNASSVGAYLTGERYFGKHGLSLKLDGLEASNSNARARAIVLHSAEYMSGDFIATHKRPGRSFGCFVVQPPLIQDVVEKLEGGVLIYAGR